jgi:hypothetical protein
MDSIGIECGQLKIVRILKSSSWRLMKGKFSIKAWDEYAAEKLHDN